MIVRTDLYQISLPYFCAGIVVGSDTGVITAAAPVMNWAIGNDIAKVTKWVENKRGTIINIEV